MVPRICALRVVAGGLRLPGRHTGVCRASRAGVHVLAVLRSPSFDEEPTHPGAPSVVLVHARGTAEEVAGGAPERVVLASLSI
jgi:hypothetical protein